jgi:hypothetical protein
MKNNPDLTRALSFLSPGRFLKAIPRTILGHLRTHTDGPIGWYPCAARYTPHQFVFSFD